MALATDHVPVGDESIYQPDGGRMTEPERLAELIDGALAEEFP